MNSAEGMEISRRSTEPHNPEPRERNLGLDLLRIIAAFLVVFHHSLHALGEPLPRSLDFCITGLFAFVALCPVPVFVLISGAVAFVRNTEREALQ